jgi:spoIIIJ-associated protein
MTLLEFEGKNLEKALDKASAKLNIPKDDLKYDILSYGSSGIFGLAGTKKARVQVNVADESPESITETSSFEEQSDFTGEKVEPEAAVDAGFSVNGESDAPPVFTFPQDPLEVGRSVLQRIIDAITSDAKISVAEESDRILFEVAGGNAAILIGKRGQTLEAIQSLVDKVVNKHNHNDNRIRVQVDIEGYLETRRENLVQLAHRLAEKSQRIRKPISMGQMNAYDRRIVHLALQDDPKVSTKSRGEGHLRKIVIFPKRNSKKNG